MDLNNKATRKLLEKTIIPETRKSLEQSYIDDIILFCGGIALGSSLKTGNIWLMLGAIICIIYAFRLVYVGKRCISSSALVDIARGLRSVEKNRGGKSSEGSTSGKVH